MLLSIAVLVCVMCFSHFRQKHTMNPVTSKIEAVTESELVGTTKSQNIDTKTEPFDETAQLEQTSPDKTEPINEAAQSEQKSSEQIEQIDEAAQLEQKMEHMLETMTLEEKAAQLFVVLPEALVDGVGCVTAAGEMTQNAINDIPVGGMIYMEKNLQSEEQVKTMLNNVQSYSMQRIGVPAFLCVDEEGGTVTRISGTGKFHVPSIESMLTIGQTQDIERAYEVGESMGQYLSQLGFNVDFAPVADVLSNPNNQVVKNRSFGSEPQMVSDMSFALWSGLRQNGIYGTYKHFPGHGATEGDTHAGYSYTEKTLEELKSCELIPFWDGIDKGIAFVMVGHISVPNVTGDATPASLSKQVITDLLREEMGYDGIVITDAFNMGAIVGQYSSAQAAVKTLQAGTDLILMPADFHSAYQGVLDAVRNGELSEQRVDESLRRILRIKLQMQSNM